jgi:hypothetical protein
MTYEIRNVNSIKFVALNKKDHKPILLDGKPCEGFSPNQIKLKLQKAGIK